MYFYEVRGNEFGPTRDLSEGGMSLQPDGTFTDRYDYAYSRTPYLPLHPEELTGAFAIHRDVFRKMGFPQSWGMPNKDARLLLYNVLMGKAPLPKNHIKVFFSDRYYDYVRNGVDGLQIPDLTKQAAQALGFDIEAFAEKWAQTEPFPNWNWNGERALRDGISKMWHEIYGDEGTKERYFVIGDAVVSTRYIDNYYFSWHYLDVTDIYYDGRLLTPDEIYEPLVYMMFAERGRKEIKTCLPKNPIMPNGMKCVVRELVSWEDCEQLRRQFGYGASVDWSPIANGRARFFVLAYPRSVAVVGLGATYEGKEFRLQVNPKVWRIARSEGIVGKSPSESSLDKFISALKEIVGDEFPIVERMPFRQISKEEYEQRQLAAHNSKEE